MAKEPGGFDYAVSTGALREYRAFSPADKLRWLLQSYLFVRKFAPPETRRLHERFRRGEI